MARATIRPIRSDDLDNIMSWVNDPEVVGKFAVLSRPKTREEEAKFLDDIVGSETDSLFAIEAEDGCYLGNVGLHQIDRMRGSGRLAVILGNKERWGGGYAQSAVSELLKYAFEDAGLREVWAMHMEGNDRMHHILEKCGFKADGLMPEKYFSGGRYHNMVRMSISSDDYAAAKLAGSGEAKIASAGRPVLCAYA